MKASEAEKQLARYADDARRLLERKWCGEGLVDAAIAALREKAEREEQERKKVALAQQATAVELANADLVNDWSSPNLQALAEAAATLRKLDEDGGRLLTKHRDELGKQLTWCKCTNCLFIRSIGVEPKP